MTHYHYFKKFLTKDTLKKLINDPDRDVRILALNASVVMFRGHELVDTIGFLCTDPAPTVRLRLTELLGNIRTESAKKILQKITKDKDFEISTEAFIALFRQSNFSLYPELRERLDNPQIKSQTASKIIKIIPLMGKDGANALLELIKHPDPTYRKTALEVYGQSFQQDSDANLLVELMADRSRTIREIAGRILLRLRKINVEHIKPLTFSPYVDVRNIALTISMKLPPPEKMEILLELLLDENTEIRLNALHEIVHRKYSGWEQIVKQTLTDDNIEIQQKTVALLLKAPSQQSNNILIDFAQRTDNAVLKKMILKRFKLGNIK